MVFFFALAFISAAVFWAAFGAELLEPVGKKPLELPEWTGRERESLRADLEAAEKAFMAHRLVTEDTAAVELEKYHIVWEEELPGIVQPYGLYPEALEAYIKKQK